MEDRDFSKEKPFFDNGQFKWYSDNHFKRLIENEQADNLPKLKNLFCFVVIGNEIKDYVLIDNNQNVIAGYPYNNDGFEKMEVKIKMLKIIKHFNNE